MSENPLTNYNDDWLRLSATQPSGSFDGPAEYHGNNNSGSTGVGWHHPTQGNDLALGFTATTSFVTDEHYAQSDDAYALTAPALPSEATGQQFYPTNQVYYALDPTTSVPPHGFGLDSTYAQPSYVLNQPLLGTGTIEPTLTQMTLGQNPELFHPALGMPSAGPSQFPAPQSVAPVAHPALVLNPLEPEFQVADSQVQVVRGPKPKRQCPICRKKFNPKPSNWIRHWNACNNIKGYRCKQCGTKRVTKDQVVLHYIHDHLNVSRKIFKAASPEEQQMLRNVAHPHVQGPERN